MTVSSQTSDVSYNGDGTTVTFTVPFYFLQDVDLAVSVINADGTVQPYLLGTDYTVAGAGLQAGGSITTSGTPVPTGKNVYIERNPPVTQETAYQANDPFPASEHEKALDKLTMLVQRLSRTYRGSLHFPLTDLTDGTLPQKSARAGMIQGYDALGQPIMVPMPASVGAGDMRLDAFVGGVDFTAGVTTQLTLSRAPGNPANLEIFFDGFFQGPDQWGVAGTTVTFTAPIPVGVTRVYARIGTTLSTQIPPDRSVGDSQLAWGSVLGRVVDSIANLRALDRSVYKRAFVTSYYGDGAGGGGAYRLDEADATSADNGGTIIVATDGGRWKLASTSVVTLRQFGAKGDGTTDDTARVQAACTWAYTNKKQLFVESGTYKLTAKVSTPGPITLVGELQSPSVTPAYQQAQPQVTFLSTVVADYALSFGSATYERGGQLRNFRVYGAGVDGSGIYLHNQGWDGVIDSVTVEGFQRNGVTMDYVQDMHVCALGIIDCGMENAYPSLNMVNGCNSVHFDRLHIEITPYMMNINACADITFNGCHFEVSEYPSGGITVVNRYSRFSQIILNNGTNHVDFNACLFAPNSVQGVAAHFSVAETSIGPFMTVSGGLKINIRACQFRQTQPGKSSNMISFTNSSSCLMEGNSIDQVFTDQNCIVLSGTTFVNNDVTWLDTGGTLLHGIANSASGSPSFVDKNRLFCINPGGSAKSAGYIFATGNAAAPLKIGNNEITINKFYKNHNSLCQADGWVQNQTIDLTGFGGTLDLESYDINTQFKWTATSTVNSIINMCPSQRVKFWNNGVGTVTVANAGNVALKGAVNAAMGANGILCLEESGTGYLIEVSRNF